MKRAARIANEKLQRLIFHRTIVKFLTVASLVMLGFYLIFKTQIDQALAKSETSQYRIENVTAQEIQTNIETTQSSEKLAQLPEEVQPSDQFLTKFQNQTDLPLTGLISIPDLSINLPIFNENSEAAISYGASNVVNSKMGVGNYSLASHHVFDGSEKRLFAPLKYSTVGMKIYLTDKTNIYTYEVYEIFEVDQYAVHVLDEIENQTIVTLITCVDYEATYRTIVRGKLVNVQTYSETDENIRQSFEAEFNL